MEQLLFMAADTLPLSHHLSTASFICAAAPPAVKSATSRRRLKTRRRPKRRSPPPSGDGFFSGDGGFIGGGGRGWISDGFGGGFHDWDGDHSSSDPDDPAFDFVYEVVCWIVFSNCLHFAFKRAMSLMVVSEEREKMVPLRLASVC